MVVPSKKGPLAAPPSSNWQKLQQRIGSGSSGTNGSKRKREPDAQADAAARKRAPSLTPGAPAASAGPLAAPAPTVGAAPVRVPEHFLTSRLALDCEMVGVGSSGSRSALARVVIVNFDEVVVYSAFVQPRERVTDFRTEFSGVRPEHMRHALPLQQVQMEVAQLLKSRVLIGHALWNDLKVLMLSHSPQMTRDTALYEPYQKQSGAKLRPHKLQHLAREHLGWQIQTGGVLAAPPPTRAAPRRTDRSPAPSSSADASGHSPCEDAVAALRLYKLRMAEWERAAARQGAPKPFKESWGRKRKEKRGVGKKGPS